MNHPAPTSTTRTRPSHNLPAPIFEAIIALEDQVRLVEGLDSGKDPRGYLTAAIETGRLRDDLADLILQAVAR